MTFDQWLASVALGEALTSDFPAIGLQALSEGHESALRAARAGASTGELSPAELQELLERGLREVGKQVPTRVEAGWILRQHYAAQVARGALLPRG